MIFARLVVTPAARAMNAYSMKESQFTKHVFILHMNCNVVAYPLSRADLILRFLCRAKHRCQCISLYHLLFTATRYLHSQAGTNLPVNSKLSSDAYADVQNSCQHTFKSGCVYIPTDFFLSTCEVLCCGTLLTPGNVFICYITNQECGFQ